MVGRFNHPNVGAGLPVENAATIKGILMRGIKGGKSGPEIVSHAENLLKEKATLKEIYDETGKMAHPENETGLRLTPDKQWVTDITDKDARITPYAAGQLTAKPGAELGGIPLSTAYKHDLLYDYVPEIKDVPVQMEQLIPGSADRPGAAFNPPEMQGVGPKGSIETYGRGDVNDLSDIFSQRSLFAHEINHWLSRHFGLSSGANPGGDGLAETPGMAGTFQQKMIPQANKLLEFLQKDKEKFLKQYSQDPNALEMWYRMFPEKEDALQQALRVGGGKLPMKSRVFPPDSRHFEYESVAGEQAARTSQEMAGMSAEEMRADSPYFKMAPRKINPKTGAYEATYLPPALQMINKPNAKGGIDWALPDLDFWKRNLDVRR